VDVYAGGPFTVSDMCECVIDGWGGVGGPITFKYTLIKQIRRRSGRRLHIVTWNMFCHGICVDIDVTCYVLGVGLR